MQKSIILLIIILNIVSCSVTKSDNLGNTVAPSQGKSRLIVEEYVNLQTFIVLKYNGITDDIIAGDGPFIQALLQIIKVNHQDTNSEIKRIKILLANSDSIYDFSEKIISNYSPDNF